jgi:hypothetical protein
MAEKISKSNYKKFFLITNKFIFIRTVWFGKEEVMSDKIRTIKTVEISGWDLECLNIKNVHVPKKDVHELKKSTNFSMGILKKFNVFNGDTPYYVKSGNSKGNFFSIREPILEYISSQIGLKLGFDTAEYKLWLIDRDLLSGLEDSDYTPNDEISSGSPSIATLTSTRSSFQKTLTDNNKVLVTISKSFIPREAVFHTCEKLFPEFKSDLYQAFVALSPSIKRQLDQMIVFDFIINNTDRHTKNFGVLQYSDDQFKLAPLYDHGLSLVSDIDEQEIIECGIETLSFKPGQPFRSLTGALKLVSKESLAGIKFEVEPQELMGIIDIYADVFSEARITIMKEIIKLRWSYVRKTFS